MFIIENKKLEIMKKITYLILLIILPLMTKALDLNVTSNWTSSQNEIYNTITIDNSGVIFTVDNDHIIECSIFDVSNNLTININEGAKLIINGDFIIKNNLTINLEGTLIIDGNVTINNNADLNIESTGTMGVSGDFDIESGTITNDGNINIGGVYNGPIPTGTGTIEELHDDPLPIELKYFNGSNYKGFNELSWVTYSEINNDYFLIEYSNNGYNWDELMVVDGAGNSNTIKKYTYIHYIKKSLYYKLTQFDYDGKNESFNIIFIESSYINKDIKYDVYDLNGKFIFKKKYNNINLTGIYILKNGLEVKKVNF